MTNLNTTEYKYYGFYHRIRQKLEQYWGNSIQEKAKKLYKVGRRLPASENMITAITVVLDDHGSIVDIKVDGTSGVRELDQAAIESFNKAGPFPNPPKGLLVDGRAIIQWGFVVKG
jgi:protein TonB